MLNNINFAIFNFSLAFPFLALIAGAIILLLCAAFKNIHRSFYIAFSVLCLVLSFALIYFGNYGDAFFGTLLRDDLTFVASEIILIFAAFYILMDVKPKVGEFYALLLFMVASLLLMVSSSNLILIFIGLESSSLALYTIIAMQGNNNAISSAIKYFSVAAVGSGFFVLSCALIYMKTGNLDLVQISNSSDKFVLGAFAMMLVIAGIKLSLMPFHFWLKDVYYASSANLVAFISVVPKVAMIAFLYRFFEAISPFNFVYALMVFAAFSMLVSSVVALSQNDVKKMLAFSSISHSSFALMALIPLFVDKNYSANTAMVYWALFAFSNYGAFLLLSLLKSSSYEALIGFYNAKPILAVLLGVFVLSLAGIPPFGVFWGKVLIMLANVDAGFWYLALIMAISSALIIFAYFKIIIYAFFKKNIVFGGIEKLEFSQIAILILALFGTLFCILIV